MCTLIVHVLVSVYAHTHTLAHAHPPTQHTHTPTHTHTHTRQVHHEVLLQDRKAQTVKKQLSQQNSDPADELGSKFSHRLRAFSDVSGYSGVCEIVCLFSYGTHPLMTVHVCVCVCVCLSIQKVSFVWEKLCQLFALLAQTECSLKLIFKKVGI